MIMRRMGREKKGTIIEVAEARFRRGPLSTTARPGGMAAAHGEGDDGYPLESGGGPAEGSPSPLELEHVIGYTGNHRAAALCDPEEDRAYITCLGSFVVFEDSSDPHEQEFLEAHDGEVSALAVCAEAGLIASGQTGSLRVAVSWRPEP